LSSENLELRGDIRGVQKLTQVEPAHFYRKPKPLSKKESTISWIIISITLVFWYIVVFEAETLTLLRGSIIFQLFGIICFVITIGYLAVGFGILVKSFFPSPSVPDGLEQFDE
jgi:hypothetical protein